MSALCVCVSAFCVCVSFVCVCQRCVCVSALFVCVCALCVCVCESFVQTSNSVRVCLHCVHLYIWKYLCLPVHMEISMCTYTYGNIYVHLYICKYYLYTWKFYTLCAPIHMEISMCTYTYGNIYVHLYIWKYHTSVHAHERVHGTILTQKEHAVLKSRIVQSRQQEVMQIGSVYKRATGPATWMCICVMCVCLIDLILK